MAGLAPSASVPLGQGRQLVKCEAHCASERTTWRRARPAMGSYGSQTGGRSSGSNSIRGSWQKAAWHWPRSSDVIFRLELVSDGATVAETVRSIGGPSRELVVVPVAALVQAAGAGSPSVPAVKVKAAEGAAAKESPVSELPPPQPLPNPSNRLRG